MIGNSEADLQALIDRAYMWSKSWDITFNPNKCNVIHHRIKSTPVSKYVFSMGKHNPLKIVDSCKYLGIIIDAHVDFKSCINTLAQSGTRALGVLIHKNKLVLQHYIMHVSSLSLHTAALFGVSVIYQK